MGTRQRYACWAAGGLLLGCAWIADASAAPRKPPAKAPPPPVAAPAPEPAPPPAPDPAPAPARAPVSTEGVPTAQLLAQAQQACEADEYDVCAERAAAVLARGDVTDEQRAQAFMLQGGAASVLGRGADAERAYRLLLRIKPDYDLPPDTPPKMAGNFRKVQAEEGEIRRAVKEAQRQKLVKAIKLVVDAPKDHKGGTPLPIRLNVEDPLGGIRGMTLEYRVGTAGEFATLPFQATPRGPEVEFSAAQMSTDAPLTLQYVVIARDADGDVLLAQGDREHPLETRVAAGREQLPAFYTQRRFWMVAGGAAAGVTAVGTVLLVALVAGGTVAAFTGYLLVRGDGTPPGIIGKQTLD